MVNLSTKEKLFVDSMGLFTPHTKDSEIDEQEVAKKMHMIGEWMVVMRYIDEYESRQKSALLEKVYRKSLAISNEA